MCPYYGEGYDGDYFAERKSIKRTMSLDEIRLLLQKAKDARIEQINLTPNGEFFLHKQWREILRLTKEFGLQTVITSNGGLLREEDIKEICEIGIDRITISIDSLNYDHYKIIRKPATHAAYTRAINAPILFKKYNPKIYVQVQATEQPNLMPNNDMQEILDFYKKAKLNQINVNKMFKGSNEKMMHYGAKRGKYIHGTCKGYGNPIILPDGKVVPCCGGYYFYTRIEEHIPNVLQKTTLKEAMQRIDDLYEFNDIFRNYCKNCSLYDANSDKSERVFIFENYFATQTEITTRYFLLPIYLRPLPAGLILWLYKKGYARKIKRFLAKFSL